MHPGKVRTGFSQVGHPQTQTPVFTAPAPVHPPRRLLSLGVFVHSAPHGSLPTSILVTPTPLFSEGVSDVAEGGVGPYAGRHLPRAHAGADSDEVYLHQSVRVSPGVCGAGSAK